ncbi:MAG: ankyrin repeat domain-containing protein [Gemmataceae bacterium]
MPDPTRRSFLAAGAAAGLTGLPMTADADDKPKPPDRDYPAPKFVPKRKRPKLGDTLVEDFVIYAHSDLEMTKKLLAKEPMLANAYVDWGGGDWESGLGGASHMGRRDIAEFLLASGTRGDVFAFTMLGNLDAVKAMLTAFPKLIDARGPHGFSLHFHAQVGGKDAEKVLEYLQSVKKVELKPLPPGMMPKK